MQEVPLPMYTVQDEKIARLEALVHRLLQDYRIGSSLMGPFPSADSAVGLRRAGSYYHLSNTLNVQPTLTTNAPSANYLYAVPFYTPSPVIADRIAILGVSAGDAGNARLGIYDSDRNCYPSRLLLDAGTVDTSSTGLKAITIRQGLARGLKWLVAVFNATPTVRTVDVAGPGIWSPLGVNPSTLRPFGGWYKSFNYAALPSVYPSGGTEWSDPLALALRLAV